MGNFKRIALCMVLFTGLASLSFGEAFYSFSNGSYQMTEKFLEEDFSRDQGGINANFTFNFFPHNFFLGAFAQTTFIFLSFGSEANSKERTAVNYYDMLDIRTCIAPSFKIQVGPRFRIPISIGPSLSVLRETGEDDTGNIYEALTLGAMADAALVFNPSKWFFLKHGLSFEWDFLRTERGKMDSRYRTTQSGQFRGVPYRAVYGTMYFGVGVRFE